MSPADYFFLPPARVRDVLRRGTFAPFLRASLNPIAIACLRLVTLRPEPLLSVPFFLRRIADFTAQQEDLKARVTGALAYPIFLGVAGVLVLNALIIFFVPRFEQSFSVSEP